MILAGMYNYFPTDELGSNAPKGVPSVFWIRFPQEIRNFANQFVRMQDLRHLADYDPFQDFSRLEVLLQLENTKTAIAQFEQAHRTDRRAFAVFVLFDLRRD